MRLTFLITLFAATLAAADPPRRITETDLYQFTWVADPQISPDGQRVVYTRVTVNKKHDNYETALWIIPSAGGAPRQLTAGPRDASARWSPDGKTLAFVRSTETSGQIHLLSLEGGEARPLTGIPKGASSPVWSPDGRLIVFSSTAIDADFDPKQPEEKSDVKVITRAAYRNNGTGYSDPERRPHLWVVDVPTVPAGVAKARQLTKGEFSESGALWSRDSARVFFTSNRVLEPYYESPDADLYVVDAKGGDIAKVTSIDGAISSLSLNPAGNRIAFTGAINRLGNAPQRSYSQTDLFFSDTAPGSTAKNLTTGYDFDIAASIGGDQAPPRGGESAKSLWSADGRFVFVVGAEEGRANLKRVDVETGRVTALTEGNHALSSFTATPDGNQIVALISTPTSIGELFIIDGATGKLKQLTQSNQELFSKLQLTHPETIWYKSFDGKRIQAWVQRPPDFQEGKKYPLILNIHGGPHAAYGFTFDHEFQWMAAKGYIVLYPNPRGSTTYGQDFGNVIQYHYPGDDHLDLMAGVDELIKRGWVDPDRLGVTGGSGGGVLTNWAIGHTDRFKAAVSQRSIADWTSFWYTADFTQFTSSWFRGAPWESQADFQERSPITHIRKINTPLMLIEGEADLRTPPAAGGEQMFRALKYLRKPVVMVRFPGESHELSRSGKPVHRVERLQHIVAWFDKYLLGQEIHTYDVR
ncbi:MAG: S9 family peptidase [Bryobacteraceae bacterium]|nr:S9 family peptidase [Bryobacteraceae bacterium]